MLSRTASRLAGTVARRLRQTTTATTRTRHGFSSSSSKLLRNNNNNTKGSSIKSNMLSSKHLFANKKSDSSSIINMNSSSNSMRFTKQLRAMSSSSSGGEEKNAEFNAMKKKYLGEAAKCSAAVLAKLQRGTPQQYWHWSAQSLAVLAPVALVLSPSMLNIPVDLALGVVIPAHTYMGLVMVAEDYAPQPLLKLSKLFIAVLAAVMFGGMLKMNICGAGVTESVKALWRKPKQQQQQQTLQSSEN
jgi:succinate dehydrogenase (ubiquinone) membrane anchor subunit